MKTIKTFNLLSSLECLCESHSLECGLSLCGQNSGPIYTDIGAPINRC